MALLKKVSSSNGTARKWRSEIERKLKCLFTEIRILNRKKQVGGGENEKAQHK